jgi:hypothetical protein
MSPTKTTAAPAPRRKSGPPPAGPNGLTRGRLVATRVDELEQSAIYAMLAGYGYNPDGTGLRDLLLDLVTGKAQITHADSEPAGVGVRDLLIRLARSTELAAAA